MSFMDDPVCPGGGATLSQLYPDVCVEKNMGHFGATSE